MAKKIGEDYAKKVSEEIIDQIKRGVAPWQKPWKPGERCTPENFTTGKSYTGGNSLYLMSRGIRQDFGDNRWGTYKQIADAGGQVRKGERGTQVLFFTDRERVAVKDPEGKPVKDQDGKQVYQERKREYPAIKQYTVFNVEQADKLKLPPRAETSQPEWKTHCEAEKVIRAAGPNLQHIHGDRAFYRLAEDKIVLPERDQFPTATAYYQTALHECGHSTGHPDRMDRQSLKDGMADGFASEAYAREELRAEISAMMTGERVGVGHDPQRGAAYVENWVKVLEKDPLEIHRAAGEAQRMSEYLIDRARLREAPEKEQEQQAPGKEQERIAPEKEQSAEVEKVQVGKREAVLFAAIARNDPAGVEKAIGAGAEPNARQGYDHTALSRAVAIDSPQVVDVLLARGADPNSRSENGGTPLHYSRLAGREVFDRLIAAGADPNAADKLGRTPLHLATLDKQDIHSQRLLAAGADPNARTTDGKTPLHGATSPPVMQRLINWKADLNAADKLGQTPLHLAVSDPDTAPSDRYERMVQLINSGADPNARTNRGETPLHRATLSLRDSAPTVKQLLDAGADPKARDELGNTPLHHAAWKASTDRADAVDHLLQAGAGLNTQNHSGSTPLHFAASRDSDGQAKTMTRLLSENPDLTIRDAEGKTPVEVASPTAKEIFDRRARALGGRQQETKAPDLAHHSKPSQGPQINVPLPTSRPGKELERDTGPSR